MEMFSFYSGILTIATFFATVTMAVFGPFLWKAYKRDSSQGIPMFWWPLVLGTVMLIHFIELSYFKNSIKGYSGGNQEVIMTETQTRVILEAIGIMNDTRIMDLVEKKLNEVDPNAVDTEQDLFLLEEMIIQVIYSGRECTEYLKFKLPNGEYLSDVMTDIYPAEKIRSDIQKFSKEIFGTNITNRERLDAVGSFLEKRKYELIHIILERGFEDKTQLSKIRGD